MVIAKNAPYEFKCMNLVEGSRSSLSPFPGEYKISAGLFLESSSQGDSETNPTEKGSHLSKRFLPEVASPNGVYISKSSYIIPSVGIFNQMHSRWDNRVGSYLHEYTDSLEGSIINNNSAFRTETPLTYAEIMNFNSFMPEDLSSKWDYIKDLKPQTGNTIYLSFYYRSDRAFSASVDWKIDEGENVKVKNVSCGPAWEKFTVETSFGKASQIAPYLKFEYDAAQGNIYVSPLFLSWSENEFPTTKLFLLEKWSNKFRQKALDEVYYIFRDPNPVAPIEKEIKYKDTPEGRGIVSSYCEWFKSWALLAPDYFVPLYNFAHDTNYSSFNEILNDSHVSDDLKNFFLARKGLKGNWRLWEQADVSSTDDLYIVDVIGQSTISYDPYKYITVNARVGNLLNSKITSVFNQGVDPNTTVLRSSLLKEGV